MYMSLVISYFRSYLTLNIKRYNYITHKSTAAHIAVHRRPYYKTHFNFLIVVLEFHPTMKPHPF